MESPASTDSSETDSDGGEPLLTLPVELREELKEPMGPIETDADALLEEADGPLVAVGDVVTYHFLQAGRQPDVALVDGQTKRQAVDQEIERVVFADQELGEQGGGGRTLEVTNPPATLTESLLEALGTAFDRDEPTTILVDGEEDLAVLPALLAAPEGASVVYGQPDVGMVHVVVDSESRTAARTLVERFDGDPARALALLGE